MTPTPDDAAMPDELLNPKIYPERMYMDCYGNGHHSWDRKQHPNLPHVNFRVEYIKKTIVPPEAVKKARDELDCGDFCTSMWFDRNEETIRALLIAHGGGE